MRTYAALATALIAGTLLFTSCTSSFPIHHLTNPLSTAASMRVEIEVYKGSLSKNVSLQWGELEGLVDEMADALTTFNDAIVTAASKFGYVSDCTKCNAEVSIDPHYRSKKIAKQSGGRILPRTKRPEIDTRTVEKVGGAFLHNNDSSEKAGKIKWCTSDNVYENEQLLIGCHILSNMHDDIRVLLKELNMLSDIIHRPGTVGTLKNLLDEAVDNFNKVYSLIIAAKDKVDRLKNSCADTCDSREILFVIRLNLEEAKGMLKKNKILWNASKDVSRDLEATLRKVKDTSAVKFIAEEAIVLSQRINERVLPVIESVNKTVDEIDAETHVPFFATHPLTLAEWSRGLERAASEIAQLSDFLLKQVRRCRDARAVATPSMDHEDFLESASCEQRKQIMKQVGRVAMKLKAKALYWAEAHVGVAPQDRKVRVTMAAFANLVSEYSNQMESLADGLQWQLGEEGKRINARQLPLSVYLRNAETTDFLNLYTWNRAAALAIWEEMLLHPHNAFTSNETADRVRVIERLFADLNWEKINTAYGSGQGDFSMALVKDEIGNWNLKSFDSDPTELVTAYTKFTLTSINRASSLLTGGGSLPESLLRSSGNLIQEQIDGRARLSDVLNTNTLHKQVAERLETIKADATTKKTKVIERILDVLDDYEVVIDLLQEALMTSNLQRTM